MACWDIYCVICGNTCHGMLLQCSDNENEYCKIASKIGTKLKWLEQCTFLTVDNNIVHDCQQKSRTVNAGTFYRGNEQYEHVSRYFSGNFDDILSLTYQPKNIGVYIHTDCWNYIKQKYNFELKYENLPIKRNNLLHFNKVIDVHYGEIENYWGEYFKFDRMFYDEKQYLCESPLINKENAHRIKKIITKLFIGSNIKKANMKTSDIKKYIIKKEPMIPIEFYKHGTIKVGGDKKFWKITNGKWTKMTGIPIIKTIVVLMNDEKSMKKLNAIPHIGDYGIKPQFVNFYEINYNKRKILCELYILLKY